MPLEKHSHGVLPPTSFNPAHILQLRVTCPETILMPIQVKEKGHQKMPFSIIGLNELLSTKSAFGCTNGRSKVGGS